MTSFKLYSWTLLVGVLAVVAAVLGLNLLLASRNADSERFLQASEWQERTHGITFALIQGRDTGPFKTLRLIDRVADSNAIVFGSSTAMGMQSDMFPPQVRIYNFSQYANHLSTIIGQVEYVLDHYQHVRWMFVPLEWSMGFLFFPGEIPVLDFSKDHVLEDIRARNKALPWKAAIKEALSHPKIMNLFRVIRMIASSEDKAGALRATFLHRSGHEYGTEAGLVRDFEPETSTGFGFQYDGSADYGPGPGDSRSIMNTSVNTFARTVLPMTKGEPQAKYLSRLAVLARRLESRGGKMIFFMPPLFPGLEAEVLKRPDLGPYLEHTKTVIREWSQSNRLNVLDFGPSEDFGCTTSEFIDGPHSRPDCYRKALNAAWRLYPDLLPSDRPRDTGATADASLR